MKPAIVLFLVLYDLITIILSFHVSPSFHLHIAKHWLNNATQKFFKSKKTLEENLQKIFHFLPVVVVVAFLVVVVVVVRTTRTCSRLQKANNFTATTKQRNHGKNT